MVLKLGFIGKVRLVKLEQPEKQSLPIVVKLSGKFNAPLIDEQLEKVNRPILVILLCKINDVNEEHSLNTLLLITVILSGISKTPVKPLQ